MLNGELPYHRSPRLTRNTRSALRLRDLHAFCNIDCSACLAPCNAKRSSNSGLMIVHASRFSHELSLAAPIASHLHMAELGFPAPRTRHRSPLAPENILLGPNAVKFCFVVHWHWQQRTVLPSRRCGDSWGPIFCSRQSFKSGVR
jgi:hypothetical protein